MWVGVVFVRQGLYKGGIFKFSVQIPKEFPDGTPPVSEVMPVGLRTFATSPCPYPPTVHHPAPTPLQCITLPLPPYSASPCPYPPTVHHLCHITPAPTPLQCITFDHKVYHPQVDPCSGEVNLTNEEFPRKPRLPQHVYQVLECMRSLFFTIDPTGATNQEAEQL